ncbi:MAG: MmcQ/YjbR family DNA-binding protein, partial [Clostridia bacterium]|nr:MmcQ/YjbR family DNA-binding protein [Clostridia bacterium]
IIDDQFALTIKITNSDINTDVIDLSTNEPYTLFLDDEASGSFVGAVRTSYKNVMLDIAEKCFDKCVFKSEYAQKIIRYVENKFGDNLEYLWDKFPDNAIWRRKDNRKWYGALLTVTKNKLGLPSNDKIEIIDLRTNPENIDFIVDNKNIFKGYHMNKKHWITICLDGTVPLEKFEKLIDKSYELARKS